MKLGSLTDIQSLLTLINYIVSFDQLKCAIRHHKFLFLNYVNLLIRCNQLTILLVDLIQPQLSHRDVDYHQLFQTTHHLFHFYSLNRNGRYHFKEFTYPSKFNYFWFKTGDLQIAISTKDRFTLIYYILPPAAFLNPEFLCGISSGGHHHQVLH